MIILASSNVTILDKWSNALRGSHQISTASNFDALNKILADSGPACVALDRNLPGSKLIETVQSIRRTSPETKIVLLNDPALPQSDQEELAFLKAGVRGFCSTGMEPNMICKVLDAVEQGQIWVRRRLIPAIINELSKHGQGTVDVSPNALNY